MTEERSVMAPAKKCRMDSLAAVARLKENGEYSAFVEILCEEKKFGESTMDMQSLEGDSLHPGRFMEKVLFTEAQTHPSHSDTEVCWPAHSPEFCKWGEYVLDGNTNCLVYRESQQPTQRVFVENPPSQPCSCQRNAGNSSQQACGTKKDPPQCRSRGEQAELGGTAPLPGAGPASNTPVSGAGQHMCPQSELTFRLLSTAGQGCPSGEGPSAQQQPWPTRSPAPFMPFPSQPFIFNGAQGAVVPGAWRGPLCSHVQSHTRCVMHTQCCWQNWQALAYTPRLYRMYPPVGCYLPQCSTMPAAWQPQMECGAALRTCPNLETQAVPGQSRPTAMQTGLAGLPCGSEQTAAADVRSPGYPVPETMAKNCCNKTDRARFNEDKTFASREWKKENMKGNGPSCSYQSPTPPCSFAVRRSEVQADTTSDRSSTRNVKAASSSKASTSKPLSTQGNPDSQLFSALNSPQTGLSGELASCCPYCGQPNVSGQIYCSSYPGHCCLINGVCTLRVPHYCCLARLEQQRTGLTSLPSAAVPASLDDRGLQLSPETTPTPNSFQTPESYKMSCGATGQRAEGAKSQREEETADTTEPVSGGPTTNSLVPTAADADSLSLWSKNDLLVQQEDNCAMNWSVDVQFDSFSMSRNLSLFDCCNREDSIFADSVFEDALQKMSRASGTGAVETVESADPTMRRPCSNEQKTQASSQPTVRLVFKKSARKPSVKDEVVQKLCDESIINACISVDRLPEILLKQHGAKEHTTNNRKEDKTAGADNPCKRRCCCVAQSTPEPKEKQNPNSMLPNDQDGITDGTPTCSSYSTCSQSPAPINVMINVQIESQFSSAEALNQIKQRLSEALEEGMKAFQRQ